MRILILSQFFHPEPFFKGLPFARELARRGHEVEVLTGFPNYPGGKLYPGYRVRMWQRETIDGISVVRVPLFPSHSKSPLPRILNYATFALSASLLGPALIRRPDVVYVYHPPPTVGLPAVLISTLLRVPIVYDIQDLWPETVAATGMLNSRAALAVLRAWCQWLYGQADYITVLSPGFRGALTNAGVFARKIEVIYNWCDETGIEPNGPPPMPLVTTGKFTVLFAGTMGIAQGLETVLKAALICLDAAPQVRFVFIGGGIERERLERTAKEMKLRNVQFLPRQPASKMGPILHAADALLVHLKDDPLFRITIPSKTQTYLAAGKPIIMAVRGDAAHLVSRAGAGVLAEPENPVSLAAAVRLLSEIPESERRAMGQAGRSFYARELALTVAAKKFEKIFESAIAEYAGSHALPYLQRKRM